MPNSYHEQKRWYLRLRYITQDGREKVIETKPMAYRQAVKALTKWSRVVADLVELPNG